MELIWRDVYNRAVELFAGQTPGDQLEAELIERFEERPAALVAAVDKLGVRFASGKIHSPWPLLLRELNEAPARETIHASDESERAKAIHLAERYIATAGVFLPSEAELVDELFGARGRLKRWPELQAHMLALWQAGQPAAAQAEREQLERAQRWKQAHSGRAPDIDWPAH